MTKKRVLTEQELRLAVIAVESVLDVETTLILRAAEEGEAQSELDDWRREIEALNTARLLLVEYRDREAAFRRLSE